ncbi:MAG TPA: ornithine carbamoyltransferase [Deltaproteobacteria bacterium]|nr:ornithine carbamoyltransferase [Deltaproteobacteria bacterium]
MPRHFLSILELTPDEIHGLFKLTADLKAKQKSGKAEQLLKGKTLAMIFQKPSARTRVSFEVGMVQLGGHAVYLAPTEIGLGKRESAADVARVLSRYTDGMMARLFGHDLIEELARHASVPVINGLTDFNHPCQVLGDIFTILEHRGSLDGLTVAYVGDGNNMVHSWLNAAARLPMTLRLACPGGYDPDPAVVENAVQAGKSEIVLLRDPQKAVRGADVIYTDVWASMGQEAEAGARKEVFRPFQVNESLVRLAKPDVKVMHCLPAHRGDEITDGVMDGPHSIVFDEAENRLHVQKAIMVMLMKDG